MATKADNETPTILRKLAVFLVLFYLIYYLDSIILVGAFKAGWNELGKYPFRIRRLEFDPGLGGPALGAWLAMVITYTLSLTLAFWVVRVTRKTWDYVITTSVFHFVVCCIVNQAFPVNWIWWVTLIIANIAVSLTSELLIYRLRDLRDIELNH
mmetsp:Transcript_27754/g.70752  ORF Transcript_27754/g.70752 Transcript_27754/m.70752 type:complete len:154 (-) Transcript_27754:889-1350(-)|eukprot:CAMPEP_0202857528 /NCGR_PEP_ID=MMETSP1391-20130828/434_1 /ASSEMBLY_ACC=CAM_ASM_000867 /TAXON_ID=1034604 /ORGANISM="Chlamydomonas leiostraca, Strain SAG 11-49" /LENGTH=153 /DNA_ID=CAMNT_0049536339 /DNA_START=264 /DNA_END=725 /DNA_ORIENTATION=-